MATKVGKIVRRPGHMYYADKNGNVMEVKMRSGGKRGKRKGKRS